jgi:site-specific recombinase XerD
MIEDMRVRNFSLNTQQLYVDRVAKLAQYFGKSPELLGPEDVRTYQVYLIKQKSASWSMLNQTVCALRFLYRTTLGKEWAIQHIPAPKKEQKLPVVLSQDEVSRFFESLPNLKHRAILMTAYAAGLRVSEVASLRVADIDSQRMMIRIELGKGRKRPLYHALAECARAPARLLEDGSSHRLSFPRPQPRPAYHHNKDLPSLCQGQRFGRPDQAGTCTCVEAFLRDSSYGIGR